MDLGLRTPLVDLFRKGEAPRDVKLLAAQGDIAPRAQEQLALLALLVEDADPEVSAAARATLERVPIETIAAVLGHPETPSELRSFFAARGVAQPLRRWRWSFRVFLTKNWQALSFSAGRS